MDTMTSRTLTKFTVNNDLGGVETTEVIVDLIDFATFKFTAFDAENVMVVAFGFPLSEFGKVYAAGFYMEAGSDGPVSFTTQQYKNFELALLSAALDQLSDDGVPHIWWKETVEYFARLVNSTNQSLFDYCTELCIEPE